MDGRDVFDACSHTRHLVRVITLSSLRPSLVTNGIPTLTLACAGAVYSCTHACECAPARASYCLLAPGLPGRRAAGRGSLQLTFACLLRHVVAGRKRRHDSRRDRHRRSRRRSFISTGVRRYCLLCHCWRSIYLSIFEPTDARLPPSIYYFHARRASTQSMHPRKLRTLRAIVRALALPPVARHQAARPPCLLHPSIRRTGATFTQLQLH